VITVHAKRVVGRVCPVLLLLALALLAPSNVGAQTEKPVLSIKALSQEIRHLTDRVGPAVVQIYSSSFGAVAGSVPAGAALFGQQQATGSGIILDPTGYIITNNHVVQGARRVQVRLSPAALGQDSGQSILQGGGALVGAQVIGVDKETDLAVLKIDRTDLPYLTLGDSDAIFQGQLVFAFGSPMGLNNSVSFGVVSTVARQMEQDNPMIYIQTDVAINPGNSGGPLVNVDGEVIGINTMIFTQGGGSEGLSFSAPSNIVRNVFNQIRAVGRVKRGIIGVNAQTVTPWLNEAMGLSVSSGVIMGDVYPGGPADEANLQVGDIVLALDGKPMENARQFTVNLYGKEIGQKVALKVARGNKEFTAKVEVIERIDPDYHFFDKITTQRNLVSRIGVLAITLDDDTSAMLPFQPRHRQGVIVAALAASVTLIGEHFAPGDVLYTINGQQIKGMRSLKKLVRAVPFGKPAVFQLERGGKLQFLVVGLD